MRIAASYLDFEPKGMRIVESYLEFELQGMTLYKGYCAIVVQSRSERKGTRRCIGIQGLKVQRHKDAKASLQQSAQAQNEKAESFGSYADTTK